MRSAREHSVSKTHDRPVFIEMPSGCPWMDRVPRSGGLQICPGCFWSLSFLSKVPEFQTRGLSPDASVLGSFGLVSSIVVCFLGVLAPIMGGGYLFIYSFSQSELQSGPRHGSPHLPVLHSRAHDQKRSLWMSYHFPDQKPRAPIAGQRIKALRSKCRT